jgi:hypothetical protein
MLICPRLTCRYSLFLATSRRLCSSRQSFSVRAYAEVATSQHARSPADLCASPHIELTWSCVKPRTWAKPGEMIATLTNSISPNSGLLGSTLPRWKDPSGERSKGHLPLNAVDPADSIRQWLPFLLSVLRMLCRRRAPIRQRQQA